ncbi:class I glutamine amidotransferase-like protein [Aaosphaeria arxii CBS 175.79]|uniref:Class I glutamine amidotransferase-like protein n=1 Tax=Aaosphaeria arxii CBS 175.79 TaxID=1450172 RepID=A0A6A5XX52_9PLEO|nr:class I glutamine amidotransferase-like protein [Aaosphaeria arxii CBS 175.79]KAF2017407.1 class I glutamine amidotransferase-like protein [Aaosphaeria arxii CBS 175.79]
MRVSSFAPLLAALGPVLAIPTQPSIDNSTEYPKHYGMLVFPHFQALDVFGPLDVLNTLAMVYKLPMQLSIISATLDPVSTGMGPSSFGESIVPTSTFAQVQSEYGNAQARDTGNVTVPGNSTDLGDVDVLFVPGGGGTRKDLTAEIDFVKNMFPKVKHVISVCTGATILARAGVLDGRNATTNKKSWQWATSTGPNVNWVPAARWVEDGNLWSSSGISAGIDVTYAWVASVFGEGVASYIADVSEYERWMDPHSDPFADIWDVYATNSTNPASR